MRFCDNGGELQVSEKETYLKCADFSHFSDVEISQQFSGNIVKRISDHVNEFKFNGKSSSYILQNIKIFWIL